jgi:hypothetical protein
MSGQMDSTAVYAKPAVYLTRVFEALDEISVICGSFILCVLCVSVVNFKSFK